MLYNPRKNNIMINILGILILLTLFGSIFVLLKDINESKFKNIKKISIILNKNMTENTFREMYSFKDSTIEIPGFIHCYKYDGFKYNNSLKMNKIEQVKTYNTFNFTYGNLGKILDKKFYEEIIVQKDNIISYYYYIKSIRSTIHTLVEIKAGKLEGQIIYFPKLIELLKKYVKSSYGKSMEKNIKFHDDGYGITISNKDISEYILQPEDLIVVNA